MTDQEIFDGIASKDNQTFLYLYQEYREMIRVMVQKNNGSEDDALDIFQEGLIALWANIDQGKFQLREKARISTYLYALCKNLWVSRLRKNKKLYALDDDKAAEIAEEVAPMTERYDRIQELEQQFSELAESCKKLLSLFYYQKVSMKEIAQELDITEASAKNNKYRCMEKLRAMHNNTGA